MKIKLVFHDWLENGRSIYNTLVGVCLASGDFHHGTTFTGTIDVDEEQEDALREALSGDYIPAFWIQTNNIPYKTQEPIPPMRGLALWMRGLLYSPSLTMPAPWMDSIPVDIQRFIYQSLGLHPTRDVIKRTFIEAARRLLKA